MKKALFTAMMFLSLSARAQPNCLIYKGSNPNCFEACEAANVAAERQGSGDSQVLFDKAIGLCPQFDYAYSEKSVPYLKRGDFITWKKLMDQAVRINPRGQLGYRGWCRYQFVRDYKGAIEDFERLDSLLPHDIGYAVNGDYHLNMAKAFCYRAIGKKEKALQIMEKQLSNKEYWPMPYDYLHVGVLKMEMGDMEGGILFLKKSISYNDYLAEPYYYLGLIYKSKHMTALAKENLEKARVYYLKRYRLFDPYTEHMDKVYLANIEMQLTQL